jgi:hypothetical protein
LSMRLVRLTSPPLREIYLPSVAMMGNVVVWKPSDHQVFSANVLMDVFREAGTSRWCDQYGFWRSRNDHQYRA